MQFTDVNIVSQISSSCCPKRTARPIKCYHTQSCCTFGPLWRPKFGETLTHSMRFCTSHFPVSSSSLRQEESCLHILILLGRFYWHTWWRHQMETFSALLAICEGSPRWIPPQRPVTRSCDVFVDLRLNKRLSKHWWGWWFETLSHPLWRHSFICNLTTCPCHNFNGGWAKPPSN